MPRSLSTCVLAIAAVAALAALPAACQSGGVGDPCVPDEETDATFPGFHIDESYIESRSFQCSTRICLVNHFQGRASCPLGQAQADVKACSGPGDTSCGGGKGCVVSATYAVPCNPCDKATDPTCKDTGCSDGLTCDPTHFVCACDTKSTPSLNIGGIAYTCAPFDTTCTPSATESCAGLLTAYTCHTPGACQNEYATDAAEQGEGLLPAGHGHAPRGARLRAVRRVLAAVGGEQRLLLVPLRRRRRRPAGAGLQLLHVPERLHVLGAARRPEARRRAAAHGEVLREGRHGLPEHRRGDLHGERCARRVLLRCPGGGGLAPRLGGGRRRRGRGRRRGDRLRRALRRGRGRGLLFSFRVAAARFAAVDREPTNAVVAG